MLKLGQSVGYVINDAYSEPIYFAQVSHLDGIPDCSEWRLDKDSWIRVTNAYIEDKFFNLDPSVDYIDASAVPVPITADNAVWDESKDYTPGPLNDWKS